MAAAFVSVDQIVNAIVNAQAQARPARLFGKGSPRLGFRICSELDEWGVTIALADFPNVQCGLDEYGDLDHYQSQFPEWVQTGLANQIDYDKSQTLRYSRFGDLLGFYIWNARRSSKAMEKLQLEYHGIESQLETCEIVKSLEQAFQLSRAKSSSFLPYPTSKAESAELLRICNEELCARLGEEKWSSIVRHLGLIRRKSGGGPPHSKGLRSAVPPF